MGIKIICEGVPQGYGEYFVWALLGLECFMGLTRYRSTVGFIFYPVVMIWRRFTKEKK